MPTVAVAPWVLIVYGVTLVITGSRIMAPLRRLSCKYLGGLLACSMCVGWWAGLGANLLGLPLTGLGWRHALADAFAGSTCCWAAHVVLRRLGAEEL